MKKVLLALAAFTSALALFAACSSSGSLQTPVGSVDWETNDDGELESTGTLPDGVCIEITWYDAAGDTIGEPLQVTPPSVDKIPDGVKTFTTSLIFDCDDGDGDTNASSSSVSKQNPQRMGTIRDYTFYGAPITPFDGAITFAMTVRSTDLASAKLVMQSVIANQENAPPLATVDMHFFMRYDLAGASLLISLLEDDTWLDCELAVNGGSYASLSDAVRQNINGWDALTFSVPGNLFEYDASGPWANQLAFTFETDTEGELVATFDLADEL